MDPKLLKFTQELRDRKHIFSCPIVVEIVYLG